PSGLVRFDSAGDAEGGAVDDVALLAAPACLAPDASGQTPAAALAELPAVHDLLLAHARRQPGRTLERFALLDAGPAATTAELLALRARLDARCGALLHPWLQVPGGLAGTAAPRLPPSAAVAGLIARVDQARGIWKAPAGEALRSATGLARTLSRPDQVTLGGAGIDLLIDANTRGRVLWGARTLASDPEWRYLHITRGMASLQATIERSLGWAVFEPNDEALWARVRASIESLLLGLWRAGAFQGQKPEEACFVRCDRSTMTQADLDAGRLIVQVGVAPIRPAEFVLMRVGVQVGTQAGM
ncbi:MAG: hypothetical protein RLZZ524_2770, partial [Pseudomonadota bacterium]